MPKVISFVLILFVGYQPYAATITSKNTTGFWDVGSTWVGDIAPAPGDDVVIDASATITVRTDVNCNSLTWTGNPSSSRTLTINNGFTLTVNGDIVLGPPTSGTKNRVIFVDGSLVCGGNFEMQSSGNTSRDIVLNIASTGNVSIAAHLIMPSPFNRHHVDMSAGAVLNVGGNIGNAATPTAAGGGFTAPPSTSVINLNGNSVQNVFLYGGASSLGILKINNPVGATLRSPITTVSLTIGDIVGSSILKDSGYQITSTGTLTMNNQASFLLGRAAAASSFPAFSSMTLDLGTIIEYASGVSQNVSTAPNYANLYLSGASKVIASGTLQIREDLNINSGTYNGGTNNPAVLLGGDFANSGTFTSGSGLFSFNGQNNQLISGTAIFSGGITINNSGAGGSNIVSLANAITLSGDLTITQGRLDLGSFTANRTSAGGTLTVNNGAMLIIGGTNSLPLNFSTHSYGLLSFVEYNGTSNVVAAPNGGAAYGNLLINASAASTTASFPIAGTLTVNGVLNASAGTIDMNAGTSSIANSGTVSFFNLTISGSTVPCTGDVSVGNIMTVSGIFNPSAASVISGSGTLTGTGEIRINRIGVNPGLSGQYTIATKVLANLTANYSGSGSQNIHALNYGTLVITDNVVKTVTFEASGNIRVSGSFTPSASPSITYVVTNSNLEYNGSGAQSITPFTYYGLILSNAGIKLINSTSTVNCRTFTVNDAAELEIEDGGNLNITG